MNNNLWTLKHRDSAIEALMDSAIRMVPNLDEERVVRVAETITRMQGDSEVRLGSLAEAVQYASSNGNPLTFMSAANEKVGGESSSTIASRLKTKEDWDAADMVSARAGDVYRAYLSDNPQDRPEQFAGSFA